jgi:glycosyltransferase involved in cell wall biosynthesis
MQSQAVFGKSDVMRGLRRMRATARRTGIDAAFIHSLDWRRQSNPQLYELALTFLPVRERYIVSERDSRVDRIGRMQCAAGLLRMPIDAMGATMAITGESARFLWLRRQQAPPARRSTNSRDMPWVLAVWPGNLGGFGGSATHIRGILGGLRNCGFRIALVTRFAPPESLRSLADECKVLPALPSSRRINADAEHISCNVALRDAGLELARRLDPAFVYQRHSPFLTAGAEIASDCQVPFVLEWNSSEIWVRDNWQSQFAIERLLDPLLAAMERFVLSRATVIAAVSREAARMAIGVGARADRTLVLPNAVDVHEVDVCLDGAKPNVDGSYPKLGWAGSFGVWHGAEVAIKALAQLPEEVRLVLIGDGEMQQTCRNLAYDVGVMDRIEWTGPISREATLRKLAECDVLVSPHTPLPNTPFFGSPTKIFEYMALGRPIVASRLAQIGEILDDEVTARLVTPGDVDELGRAILDVLRSPDKGRGLGQAARREVAANHDWSDRGRTLLEGLEKASSLHRQQPMV